MRSLLAVACATSLAWLAGCSVGVGVGVGANISSSDDDDVETIHVDRPSIAQPDALWLGVVTLDENGPQQNAFHRPLHTGDRIALVIQTTTPRYVYVLNLSPDGHASLLSPKDEPRAVDGSARIPPSGDWELVAPHGLEHMAVIATRSAIPLDRRGMDHLVHLALSTGQRGDLRRFQSATPPGFSTGGYASMGVRAASLSLDRGALQIDATADDVVLLIDIDHRER
jgi:hypothetical protein